tara:strand:- start:1577 stop:2962 length:1386 start_codon:yes stop_codon:yes gene_type:complete
MKKYYLLFLLFVLTIKPINAQFGPQQIISNTTLDPRNSLPFDIDNDGDMDVLSSSGDDYKLRWYRNMDGQGNFSDEIIISEYTAWFLSIEFKDFDGDGDKDLIFLENNPRILGWFENLDGFGNFGDAQVIFEDHPLIIRGFELNDIDNDNDDDLIVKFSNHIAWYENLDGMGNYGDEIMLVESVQLVYPPVLVDIDNDGNIDLLTAHENNGPATIIWFKNLGDVSFGPMQEIYNFDFIQSDWTSIYYMLFDDVNSDQLNDLVIMTHNDDIGTFHYWLENLDGEGSFGPLQSIQNLIGFYRLYDLDNDDDLDFLGGYHFSDDFYWIENEDGLGSFGPKITISTEIDFLKDLRAADFNGDGLLDVVTASIGDDKIAWYENGVLGIEELIKTQINIYPNPSKGIINLDSNKPLKSIKVFDVLGTLLLEQENSLIQIDISTLSSGLLFIHFETDEGSFVKKVIKE